jgi:hypothetical protein
MTIEKKRHVVAALVKRGSAEEKSFDKEFWERAGHEKRFAATWEMIEEIALFKGLKNVGQSGLQRSVQHIQRREG